MSESAILYDRNSRLKPGGTPEYYMNVPPMERNSEINLDALACALMRAEALASMLHDSLKELTPKEGPNTLANTAWAIEGLIQQAQCLAGTEGAT